MKNEYTVSEVIDSNEADEDGARVFNVEADGIIAASVRFGSDGMLLSVDQNFCETETVVEILNNVRSFIDAQDR